MKKTILLFVFFVSILTIRAQENKNIYSKQVGDIKVHLLSEGQQTASIKILLEVSDEIVEKYVPDGTFANAANAFLLDDSGNYALIDAGFGRELFANLNSLNIKPEEIKVVMLTHMHGDHIGGLIKDNQKAFPNAKILVAQKEFDYWSAGDNAGAKRVLELYKDQIETFSPLALETVKVGSCSLIPLEAYGHTPGHIAFLIHSKGENLLIWGDLTHAMAVQMPHPEIAVSYDVDPETAIESRRKILKFVTEKNIPIAGMHISYPGMGTVRKAGEGYEFIPYSN